MTTKAVFPSTADRGAHKLPHQTDTTQARDVGPAGKVGDRTRRARHKLPPKDKYQGTSASRFPTRILDGGDPTKEKVWKVEGAPGDNESWTLYTDGASSREGSGAGLILTSPEGEEVTYALRFDFHMSKNKTEYETLLVGLHFAKQMGA